MKSKVRTRACGAGWVEKPLSRAICFWEIETRGVATDLGQRVSGFGTVGQIWG